MSVFLIKNNQPECTDEFIQHCLLFFPVQITGLSTYLCQGCFFTGLWGKGVIFVVVLLMVIFYKLNLLFLNTGTPCQETWPGISSSDEFRNYNFPKYKPQPLINHAPRYFVFYLKKKICIPIALNICKCEQGFKYGVLVNAGKLYIIVGRY